MATFLGRDSWQWSIEPERSEIRMDRLTWRCAGDTDLWRVTEGVPSKHYAPAFLLPTDGDFRFEATFDATLESLYDQVGILVQSSELRWLKLGVELDGRLWLSAVYTKGESDWSREPLASLPLQLAVERRSDSVFCSVREDGQWRLFRVLYLSGPVEVGPYSCAPKGNGFEALMQSPALTSL
jgi:regulation of enolase protein 1 (concanavalin A-like superfamily)